MTSLHTGTPKAFNPIASAGAPPEADDWPQDLNSLRALPCVINGERGVALVSVKKSGKNVYVAPWFVTLTSDMAVTTLEGRIIHGEDAVVAHEQVRDALEVLIALVAGHLENHDVTDAVFAEALRGAQASLDEL